MKRTRNHDLYRIQSIAAVPEQMSKQLSPYPRAGMMGAYSKNANIATMKNVFADKDTVCDTMVRLNVLTEKILLAVQWLWMIFENMTGYVIFRITRLI